MNWGDLWEYPFLANVWGTASTVIGTVVTAGSAAVAARVYSHNKKIDEYAQARQMRVYVTKVSVEFMVEMYNHSEHPIYAMQLYGTKRPLEAVLNDPVVHSQYIEINKESDGKMHDDDRLAIVEEWSEYNKHFSTFDDTYDFLEPSVKVPSQIAAVGRLAFYYDLRIRFKDSRSLKWYFDIPRKVGEISDTEPKPDLERRNLSYIALKSRWRVAKSKWQFKRRLRASYKFAEQERNRLAASSKK